MTFESTDIQSAITDRLDKINNSIYLAIQYSDSDSILINSELRTYYSSLLKNLTENRSFFIGLKMKKLILKIPILAQLIPLLTFIFLIF